MNQFFEGDQAMVKLSDADWQIATVVTREVTGHGTPQRSVRYYVILSNGMGTQVRAEQVRPV